MLKYFKESYIFTVIGLILAYVWGNHIVQGAGFKALFVVSFLAILEVTLSFDNAVINAIKLEKMTEKWRHRFITWGIAIAVFGMRFLFPIIVVAAFSGLTLFAVTKLAVQDVEQYKHYLEMSHDFLVTFGGEFLLMIFLSYFFNPEKKSHWIKCLEQPLQKLHCVKYVDVICALLALICVQHYIPDEEKVRVVLSGIFGIIIFLVVDSVSNILERISEAKAAKYGSSAKLGFVGFLYLELIDASFSLDGVLGAFAISKDIIIITIGLAIGAMFVRSLTIFMVDMKTLKQYIFLENGAHWAIGFLALIMFLSTKIEIHEVITGGVGLVIVGAAFISSLIYNKNQLENKVKEVVENRE